MHKPIEIVTRTNPGCYFYSFSEVLVRKADGDSVSRLKSLVILVSETSSRVEEGRSAKRARESERTVQTRSIHMCQSPKYTRDRALASHAHRRGHAKMIHLMT